MGHCCGGIYSLTILTGQNATVPQIKWISISPTCVTENDLSSMGEVQPLKLSPLCTCYPENRSIWRQETFPDVPLERMTCSLMNKVLSSLSNDNKPCKLR